MLFYDTVYLPKALKYRELKYVSFEGMYLNSVLDVIIPSGYAGPVSPNKSITSIKFIVHIRPC